MFIPAKTDEISATWNISDALQVPWISIGNIAAQSGQIDFIVELAASGLGVAFLPRMIAEQRKRPGITQILLAEPRTEWRLAMVRRRGTYLSHAESAWLAIVRKIHAPR